MNKPASPLCSTLRLALTLSCLLSGAVSALPEDAEQEIYVDGPSGFKVSLETGESIYFGSESEPAMVTKGSIRITGTEIRVLSDDSEILKITAIGFPARFQQQIRADEAPVHGSGDTLLFDNQAQKLSVEGNGELYQDNKFKINHQRFNFDLETKTIEGPASTDGEQAHMVFPGNGGR